jgi:tetratricopeptide (TPR) repeat protein
MNLKRIDEALADVNKAISLDPEYQIAYVTKGEILLKQDKVEEACTEFHNAIKHGFKKEQIVELMKNCK